MLRGQWLDEARLRSKSNNCDSPAQISAFESQAQEYIGSLLQDSTFIEQIEGIATLNPAFLTSLEALTSIPTDAAALATPPALFTELPSPYNSLLLSVYSHELALASANGLLGPVTSAATISAGPSPTSGAGTGTITSPPSGAGNGTLTLGSTAPPIPTSSIVTGGAPSPTGVMIMGAAAGMIGAVAALL